MPDENRVFDVTKPKHVSPSATSKPVIVGHQPVISDPMVKDDTPKPTKIEVSDSDSHSGDNSYIVSSSGEHAEPVINPPTEEEMKAAETEGQPAADESHDANAAFKISPTDGEETTSSISPVETSQESNPIPPIEEPPAEDTILPENPDTMPPAQETIQPLPQIEGLHLPEPKHSIRGVKWVLLAILVLLVAAYLAIDSGAIGSNINLPFHIFKHKPKVSTSSASSAPAASQPKSNVPDGFKEYKLAGTSITFAAPLAWGDPVSTTEPGYSKRGGSNQSDGDYAYLVNFATNKDIQVAVTLNKYLPAARDATYYDFLQWCTGTSDSKYYRSILHFSTTDKVDTPTTITCDQGPLSDVVKINSSTIEQTNVKGTADAAIGDIYTKNLDDPDLVVLRIKDAAMTNGDNIKQLLDTIKTGTTSNSTNP